FEDCERSDHGSWRLSALNCQLSALRCQLSAVSCQLSAKALKAESFHEDKLVILPEVQSSVEARDLIAVAVEHQRLAPEELADAPLGGLGPARMIDRRIHVRVEAVFARR